MTRRLSTAVALAALAAAATLGAQSADELTRAPRIPMVEFKKLLAEDKVYVIDVRAYSTYLMGHIPGSRSVPLDQLGLKAEELKKIDKPIAAYCA